ncbi:hypothetical protein WJX73_008152 [Symbiochloris irregularis]|uniref:C3H1-type domain-containing protein n=1 Tax=Symbiochloris irregularis TaxID=706552 RepID=A0AAW1PV50_9CHLO
MEGYGQPHPGMLPPGMHPMGGMGGGMMMPPGMMPPDGPMWKRQRMDDSGYEPPGSRGNKEGSIFYKTRMCNRWQEGTCTFGDRPPVPPFPQGTPTSEPEGGNGTPGHNSRPGPGSAGAPSNPEAAATEARRAQYYKSRLCNFFMQTGNCSYRDRCQYAHGYEELRKPNPGGSVPGGMADRGEGRGGGPPFPPGMMGQKGPMGGPMAQGPMGGPMGGPMDMFPPMGGGMGGGLPFPGGMPGVPPMGPQGIPADV